MILYKKENGDIFKENSRTFDVEFLDDCDEVEFENDIALAFASQEDVSVDDKGRSFLAVPNDVTKICEMACSGLSAETVTIPASVREIESGAFGLCENTKKVVWERNNEKNANLTNSLVIGENAFMKTGIKRLVLPTNCVVEKGAFSWCNNLKDIRLFNGKLSKFAPLGQIFEGSENIETMILPIEVGVKNRDFLRSLQKLNRVVFYEKNMRDKNNMAYIFSKKKQNFEDFDRFLMDCQMGKTKQN